MDNIEHFSDKYIYKYMHIYMYINACMYINIYIYILCKEIRQEARVKICFFKLAFTKICDLSTITGIISSSISNKTFITFIISLL